MIGGGAVEVLTVAGWVSLESLTGWVAMLLHDEVTLRVEMVWVGSVEVAGPILALWPEVERRRQVRLSPRPLLGSPEVQCFDASGPWRWDQVRSGSVSVGRLVPTLGSRKVQRPAAWFARFVGATRRRGREDWIVRRPVTSRWVRLLGEPGRLRKRGGGLWAAGGGGLPEVESVAQWRRSHAVRAMELCVDDGGLVAGVGDPGPVMQVAAVVAGVPLDPAVPGRCRARVSPWPFGAGVMGVQAPGVRVMRVFDIEPSDWVMVRCRSAGFWVQPGC